MEMNDKILIEMTSVVTRYPEMPMVLLAFTILLELLKLFKNTSSPEDEPAAVFLLNGQSLAFDEGRNSLKLPKLLTVWLKFYKIFELSKPVILMVSG